MNRSYFFYLSGAWPCDHWHAACLQQDWYRLKGNQCDLECTQSRMEQYHLNVKRLKVVSPSMAHYITSKLNIKVPWHKTTNKQLRCALLDRKNTIWPWGELAVTSTSVKISNCLTQFKMLQTKNVAKQKCIWLSAPGCYMLSKFLWKQ